MSNARDKSHLNINFDYELDGSKLIIHFTIMQGASKLKQVYEIEMKDLLEKYVKTGKKKILD